MQEEAKGGCTLHCLKEARGARQALLGPGSCACELYIAPSSGSAASRSTVVLSVPEGEARHG
eukprot:764514-Hanusia_phi.AAC.1